MIVLDVPERTRAEVDRFARQEDITRNQVAVDALIERYGFEGNAASQEGPLPAQADDRRLLVEYQRPDLGQECFADGRGPVGRHNLWPCPAGAHGEATAPGRTGNTETEHEVGAGAMSIQVECQSFLG